ncbi:MAG: MBL fold metallo-hydrolase [Geminicoccaceae bacterium]
MRVAVLRLLVVLVAAVVGGRGASATGCFPVAQGEGRVIPAALPAGASVGITFLGHASFLIETAGGATAVTDYNGYIRPPLVPDIATMNNAHGTHYTDVVDPGIKHVLRGWNPEGGLAHHDVTVGDLRVRNVPTSVHGRTGSEANSNSIFVFEVADLCIAHLGHLHHLLTPQHLGELGVIDVVMVPVDGAYTMSHQEMLEVLRQLDAPLVLPMHYFGPPVLERFLRLAAPEFEIVMSDSPSVALSRETLPRRPQILVLPGS